MLRNVTTIALPVSKPSVLNEVLSLNAQEYIRELHSLLVGQILNEVLSLNAQEFSSTVFQQQVAAILNEVLSLNAQEWLDIGAQQANQQHPQ